MGYKLIALDIDGTIRSNEHPLSDRTRQAVLAAIESGAIVTLATGRMFRSALEATSGLALNGPIISFQGAHVADPATGEVLWHLKMTASMVLAALDALAEWQGEILAYYGDAVYVDRLTQYVEDYAQRSKGEVRVVDSLKDMAEKGLTRLTVVGGEDEVRALEADLRASFDSRLQVTRSLPHFCEIIHPKAGKHMALAWLSSHLGIGQDQTASFGNGQEDAAMLRWAGLGVAPGGSDPVATQAADRIAPPVEEDGVAQVLEDLLDRGLIGSLPTPTTGSA